MRLRAVAVVILLSVAAAGQDRTTPRSQDLFATSEQHRFWDRTNLWLFSGVSLFRALDYASTRNFQARGRTEILLPDDVVNNAAGFAALEASGAATSMGIAYLFHRLHHHKMERWLSLGHTSVTAFGVARNYSLESKHY